MRARLALVLIILSGTSLARAQNSEPPPPTPPPPAESTSSEAPPAEAPPVEEKVDVISPTPLTGSDLDRFHFPGNLYHATGTDIEVTHAQGLGDFLSQKAGSVNRNDVGANPFEPDIQFRGFTASPQLGTPQGISVYQDGMRLNEPFGDTVLWDLVPQNAIANLDIIPGANPLFGSNTLGGAIAIQTKTGFTDPFTDVRLAGGSYGARSLQFNTGNHSGKFGYFLAGTALADDGWREDSPSRIGQLFGDLSWQQEKGSLDLSGGFTQSKLNGEGAVPVALWEQDPASVFTTPDTSRNHLAFGALRGRTALAPSLTLEGNFFVRQTSLQTLNGDNSPYFPCQEPENSGFLCASQVGGGEVKIVDQFGQFISSGTMAARNAVLNRTDTGQTTYGGMLETRLESACGRAKNFLTAGAMLDYGVVDYTSSAEVASFSPSRATIGTGLVATQSLVDLDATVQHLVVFLQDTYSPTPRLDLVASLQFSADRTDLRDQLGEGLSGHHDFHRVNPGLAATFRISPQAAAFASFGESSRAPTPVELTCADPFAPCRLPNAFVSDPQLQLVAARAFEAGLRAQAAGANGSLAFFQTDTDNEILFVSGGNAIGEGYFQNVGRTRRRGFELSSEGSRGPFSAFLAYTFLSATFETSFAESSPNNPYAQDGTLFVPSGSKIPSIPQNILKAGLNWSANARLLVGAEMIFNSSQFYRGDEANKLAPLPSFAAFNLHGSWTFRPGVAVTLDVRNVFNRRYLTFGTLSDAQPVLANDENPRFVSPGGPLRFLAGLDANF
jgi:outer membrane receptor protein involved in Fe transport